ncbi:hypothetical protein ACQ4PT_030474 [Festuca glaucescens]
MAWSLPLSYLLLPLLAIVPFLCLTKRRRVGPALSLPPSPWALPVLGHLHHLAGNLPHRAMRDITRRYGPLVLLRLGRLPVVVVSSAEAAREVMVTHDIDFATRPFTRTLRLAIPEGANGVIFTPYGDEWRQIRKICTVELLSARRVHSFRSIREEEASRLLREVAAAVPAVANLSEMMAAYVTDSAVRTIIGSRFKNRAEFLALLDRGSKLAASMSLPDFYPTSRLAMLVSRMPRRVKRLFQEQAAFIDGIVREHQENRAATADYDKYHEDLLDVLLRIQGQGDIQLSTGDIKAIIIDLFGAGSETGATTLQWTMAELIQTPRVMRKAQDEIRQALAGQTRVTEDSLAGLNYMRLVIKEALRLHLPVPLLVPRECRSDGCQILGFDVPKGTMVLVNAWAISRDPAYWDAPEEFVPERFERAGIDFKGADMEYTPFGAGRRICPGMAFGLANMELALAGLLYHFDWEMPSGLQASELDMTEEMGAAVRLRNDLLLVPIVRVPVPVD